jgi:branched-chain amino acid transport system ATP-binding protein
VLTLDSVTAGYGGTTVLRNVNLTVDPRQVVALLGPNGAGKTTLLRTASGFVKPTAGRVQFQGSTLSGQQPHQFARQGICYLPEGRGIFPSLTVAENLRAQVSSKKPREVMEEVSDLCPVLTKRLKLAAGSLSGGEQQMLALCRACLTNPSVVLVDEASLGLAPLIIDKIYEVLRRLAERGMAAVIVEQYVQRVLDLADTVYILSRGQIVHVSATSEVDADQIYNKYLGIG